VVLDHTRKVLFERDSLLPAARLYYMMPAPLDDRGHLAIF
jgi:hypothetical protein